MVGCSGTVTRTTFALLDDTSQPLELLLSVSREGRETLGAQIEGQLRQAIREGALRPGARMPSTRDLARQLGISRRIVVDAYQQMAAEGYMILRQGARSRVSAGAQVAGAGEDRPSRAVRPARFDFRPSVPDVSLFPRQVWLRSLRRALATMSDSDLGYGDPLGAMPLRSALAEHLGRVRGVIAEPAQIVVTSGYWQGLGLVCRALAAEGVRRIAFEDPSHPEPRLIAAAAGLEVVPVEVDEHGMRVERLVQAGVGAVVLTPAHQDPTGVVLAGDRRGRLLAWLRSTGAMAIEDDYDAEYRYDRAPVGALQGLEPERVVYAGSASKTLAPALRLGWLAVPRRLLASVGREKLLADQGSARIEQYAFADLLGRGEVDRHLRRMRIRYRARRDALVAALAQELPEATVRGVAAGLHVLIQLPEAFDERAIAAEAQRRRIDLATLDRYRVTTSGGPPTLLVGYGQIAEAAIASGVAELARAVRASLAG
jgi:GntR family transcriptional regulator/MocR family aminotransferase